jgi:hypothetical protein
MLGGVSTELVGSLIAHVEIQPRGAYVHRRVGVKMASSQFTAILNF